MLTKYEFPGPETQPAVVIVHGLFGSARNWGVIAKRLSAGRPVITLDLRNHGESPHLPGHSYLDLANDLANEIVEIGAPVDVIGHSMGGKTAMVLALQNPALVNRLVVADIAPIGYRHTQMPLVRAMQALDLTKIASRKEADVALAAAIPEPGIRAFLIQSLELRAQDRRWKLNLDALADQMPLILGFPKITGAFANPTLFLSGGASDYIPSDSHAKIKSLFPISEFQTIPKAGHWLHAEAPAEFLTAVRAFLDR